MAALSSLQAKFSVDVVLTAGELFCDYLIIAIVADNRIWQKNSAHPVLRLGRDTDLWIRAWQLSPEPRTPASHSPLSPPFGHPQACPFWAAITSSVLHSGFLTKEKWAEQTLSLLGLSVVIPTENATLFGEGSLVWLDVVL